MFTAIQASLNTCIITGCCACMGELYCVYIHISNVLVPNTIVNGEEGLGVCMPVCVRQRHPVSCCRSLHLRLCACAYACSFPRVMLYAFPCVRVCSGILRAY